MSQWEARETETGYRLYLESEGDAGGGWVTAGLNSVQANRIVDFHNSSVQQEAQNYKEALERLALPMSFGAAGRASPEGQARMVYAQAVLDGDDSQTAERKAAERAKKGD